LQFLPYRFFNFADYPEAGMPVEILAPGYREVFEKGAKKKDYRFSWLYFVL